MQKYNDFNLDVQNTTIDEGRVMSTGSRRISYCLGECYNIQLSCDKSETLPCGKSRSVSINV